jgi:hypothetical protein
MDRRERDEARRSSTRGPKGLPRIISFNYSKMSGWITSYFFLELTFNGLSAALPATTDSFYILPLEAGQGNRETEREREREIERGRKGHTRDAFSTWSLPVLLDRPIKIDGRAITYHRRDRRTILRNRRAGLLAEIGHS